ncbi:MAG: 30S ribosomal protein S4 [Thermoprotei archaeon]|nr:MAG: 30S ribosomal protein S4 [Thermoprotei archaeon]RLE82624.1 MAG: 30S ribosomal protein S4 [Thermoprotei archaeon]RLF02413.1 MAG: 30S ribosomal protein S4 [Thermoprotei archaeon]
MGDPKKPRKKWEGPTRPWVKEVLMQELELIGRFGLRNKRELWIAKTFLRKIRARARSLLALPSNERKVQERILVERLHRLGLLPSKEATVDDILSLTVEHVLRRRLQTIVFEKGLATSIYHARQLITHGHIAVNGRRVRSPGYFVTREEEDKIGFYTSSPYAKQEIKVGTGGAEQT